MIKINSSQLACFSCVILLVATSCSNNPERKAFVELAVDGQVMFKEEGLSQKNLIPSHDVNNLIIETCLLSQFLGLKVKTAVASQGSHVSRLSSQESTLKVEFIIPLQSGRLIRCKSGFDKTYPKGVNSKEQFHSGCSIYKSDGQQYQYTLKLREQLQSEYGMKRDAVWKMYTFENNGKQSRESIKTAQITNENISCKTALRKQSN